MLALYWKMKKQGLLLRVEKVSYKLQESGDLFTAYLHKNKRKLFFFICIKNDISKVNHSPGA